jgi:cytochrome c biogenesis protein CcmG/thiol:disulfide interchange protein DsbE
LDGGKVELADLKGSVVMVDFWSSWCPPCRAEASSLSAVYRDYRERGIEFVGVAIWDTPEAARELLKAAESEYPAGLDEKGVIAIDYGVTGIPEKYFIDREGKIVRKFVGPMGEDILRGLLDELLE